MFDLDARVDLDEVPGAGIGVHQEFHRAGVVIARCARQFDSRLGERGANSGIEANGGSDFDHLLMPPLHGAIALVQMQHVAVAVAQNLHFDMAGAAHEAFDEDRVVAERGGGFAAGFLQESRRNRRRCSTTRMPRPPPPKAALRMRGKPISRGDLLGLPRDR